MADSGLELIFLGTGSAFTIGVDNYQSNMILKSESNKYLLLDCGTDARFSLNEQGLSHRDIDAVYVSHLHADHVGGLEWLAFTTYFDDKCKKPIMYLPKAIGNTLWNTVLAGGLKSLEGKNAKLKNYFSVDLIKKNLAFKWEDQKFYLIKTIHVKSDNTILPSYGLYFKTKKKKVLMTIDTQFTPDVLSKYFESADVIFHDCETSRIRSGVHAHYNELKKLPKHIKKKMWLYHYNPGKLPNAVKDGFLGFVKKGQSFQF